ncbi:hypothetical protein ABL78_2274 [Leptomonas seymouri]|uniref:Importin N-terminal domain-containing protein n=1 Tax=Leptomonas seymouri TaxID=5684 RepID=A0A0N0P7B3_LEPSE|nr:hypothetical protein ABL78_2274 [Leptomonas seymouri]|eukprot:KPI88606.1 hypothetical protein ABL78_2274 [Leptomonas seymouri]
MGSVEEINALAECLYANPDRSARQQAEERLNTLTQENADVTPLKAIFAQSSCQYALLFVAQGVVKWFKANRKWLSEEQRYDVVVQMCGGCVQRVSLAGAPRHVVLALMSAYAKLTKLCFEMGNFLNDAVTFALQMLYDTSPAYSRHVNQNGGCGTAGPSESNAQSGGCAGSSGSTPRPAGSSSGAGGTGIVGYGLINHSRLPHTMLSSDEERSRLNHIALVLLSTLVNEFSKYDSSKQQTFMNFSTHRRCSNNFRDECLLDVFTAAIAELEEVNYASVTIAEVLELVKDIMTFDFMAITVDETEEALSAQFPSTWKEVLLAPRTQQVLWGQHAALPFPFCGTLLTGLTSLCGIRRTFFDSTDDRVHYLDSTLGYLVNIMQLTDGRLKVPSYVSELGESCYRLVAPFGYRDLHLSCAFQPFMNGVRAISLDVFRIPFGQPGSFTTATTLLNFWSRLATSRRTFSLSEDSPKDLELISPELVACFFESRMQGSSSRGGQAAGSGGGGDGGNVNSSTIEYAMEDDEDFEATMDSILAQTEAIGNLAVLDHVRTMELLANYVNHTLGPSVLNSANATAWLFYLAAGLVRHVLSAVEEPAVEACSMFFVFCVDCANHRRNSGGSAVGSPLYSPFVERALLHFLTVTQSVLSSSRLHEALGTVVTNVFQSRTALFQFILNNTGHNIMRRVNGIHDEESAQIIRESIELILNACTDIPSSMLAELHLELPPAVELPLAQSRQTYKLRTNLHAMLWRLSSSGSYSTDALFAFLQPIELCIQSTLSGGGGNDALYTAGWMRDLRGVVLSLRDVADGLSDLVEWTCDHASSFHECLNRPAAQNSMVIISFLRLLEEIVTQIGGRYTLPCCTAHNSCGLLLFRHICSLMQSVIERCITDDHIQRVTSKGGGGMADGAYEMMLKPLALSFSILRKCIQGGFVPLGAMYYYNDDTYDNMLLGMLRMVGVFPFIYFKAYGKVSYAVVNVLRTISEEFAFRPLTKLDAGELEKVVSFVVYLCEDVDTQTGTLLHGLSFLSFIAGLIREVKALSTQNVSPAMDARAHGMSGTPPPSPMQLPSFYASPSGRLSGTPGSIGGRSGGGGGAGGRSAGPSPPRSTRLAREALARTLEPFSSLWERLISVAMNVIVCQDRALSVSCAVVYPIFETHPPFWYSFVESFVRTYPDRKQSAVREALSTLSHAAESQDKFFSEVFTFRQMMRNL